MWDCHTIPHSSSRPASVRDLPRFDPGDSTQPKRAPLTFSSLRLSPMREVVVCDADDTNEPDRFASRDVRPPSNASVWFIDCGGSFGESLEQDASAASEPDV